MVHVILDSKYRKMKQGKTWILIVPTTEMIQCFFTLTIKTIRPDCLPLICPTHFGKMWPQLRSQGYGTAQSPVVNMTLWILRLPRNESAQH